MSRSHISVKSRQIIVARARQRCEYCDIHEEDTALGCEVDHIIAEKHGGNNTVENMAYACFFCNRSKGSDLGSISKRTGNLTRLFNPRIDKWSDHFVLDADDSATIVDLTDVGEVTIRLLSFNIPERLRERILRLENS